ncbi:MAG: hypothetical protein AABZ06_12370 [Bdellovibrionota bacterium]
MSSTQAPKKNSSGIALFIVIAAMSVLSIIVTEFTYIAQVNQRIAYDALDQVKAHYLAKSAFKLSLLRLKAYQQLKSLTGGQNAGVVAVPRQLLDKIWSFPLIYPFPTTIPGLMPADRERIEKFQKESGLEGNFTALIESESSKYNLNMILAQFAPQPSPSPSPSPSPTQADQKQASQPSQPFSPEAARKSLADYLWQLLNQKFESDQDFAAEYRDFKIEDLMDHITAWADRTYQRKDSGFHDVVALKQAPFYTLSEFHMVPTMSDDIYDLFAPNLTVSTTPGINVNTMNEATLRALVPEITKDESAEFMKFRDSQTEDNSFKSEDAFFEYLMTNVAHFKDSKSAIDELKKSMTNRHIRLVVDETQFKITIRAHANQATRIIEALVTTESTEQSHKQPYADDIPDQRQQPAPNAAPPGGTAQPQNATPSSGLKITFMRIL